ncbi:MAG: zinc-binding dehydrogenase [Anaerolineae bacterium]
MRALQFDYRIPLYVLGRIPTTIGKLSAWSCAKALGRFFPAVFWSGGLRCLRYRELPEPPLPGPDWVRVRVRYGGICGSDLGYVTLHNSLSLSAYASLPCTMGHEGVGTIAELGLAVEGFAVGERVVVEPSLGCVVRGFDDLCPACARGDHGVCERRTEGAIAAGTYTGACASTGGTWSPFFVAHQSQLLRVPEEVSDENAVMSEPFAVALRAVLRNPPPEGGTALVLGAGVVGLCVIAALRALGYPNRVLVAAKHPFQAEWASHYGADEVIRPGDDRALAEALSARLHRPIVGKPVVSGGAEVVYECVGSDASLDTAIRFTRGGGTAVVLGLAAIPKGIDWAHIWLKEIAVHSSYVCGFETWQGRRVRTMQLALDLMAGGKVDLAPLVTHRFPLAEYRKALAMATRKSRHRLVKAVFVF